MLPATTRVEPRLAKLLVDRPRRWLKDVLTERLSSRILEPGDRWVSAWPDAQGLSFQHRFSAEELAEEFEAAGLAIVDRVSTYFVLHASSAEGGERDLGRAPVYRAADDVRTEKLEDALLLVDLGRGTTFRLNPTGTIIWELASQGLTVPSIATELALRVKDGPAEAELLAETRALVGELVASRLLEPARPGSVS